MDELGVGAADLYGQDRVYPSDSFLFTCHLWAYRDLASRLQPGSRVLDLACGEGYGTRELASAGLDVIGLDLEPPVLVEAARRYGQMFVAGDAFRLPFPDATFDAVGALQTIEHVSATREFVAECARVLKPNGLAYLTTPNIAQLPATASKEFNPWHLRDFTPAELQAELAPHFSVTELFGQVLDESLPRVQRLLDLARKEWEVVDRVAQVERLVRKLPGPLRVRARKLLYQLKGVGAWPNPQAEAARNAIKPEDFRAAPDPDASGCTIAICRR
jgi:ubiquinone/menaquinone biosynthesis C-methylase UbiE